MTAAIQAVTLAKLRARDSCFEQTCAAANASARHTMARSRSMYQGVEGSTETPVAWNVKNNVY